MDEIMDELKKVHRKLCFRNNASTAMIIASASLGKDYHSALASAILTLGGSHAPLEQTASLFERTFPTDYADLLLKAGKKIPGWGSSFVKNRADGTFHTLRSLILERDRTLIIKIDEITKHIQDKTGYNLYPNAACYTIASFLATKSSTRSATAFLIKARIDEWTGMYYGNLNRDIPYAPVA